MPAKKTAPDKLSNQKPAAFPEGKYFYAVGKRKTAVAQVKIIPVEKTSCGIKINGKKIEEYLFTEQLKNTISAPFTAIGQENNFYADVKVSGSGRSGQAEAIRLGIARALVEFNNDFRPILRGMGFLTRDSRVVERKKPGFKKARKSPQWAKR